MAIILMALWVCTVHVVSDILVVATFLVAVATSIFYAFQMWTMYLGLEPLVRRHWPQVLVSWTNVLAGRVADPVVGRDVLIGVALGVWFSVMFRTLALLFSRDALVSFVGDIGQASVFDGLRGTLGGVLGEAPYALRNVLLYFLVLFVMRVTFRRDWQAGVAFTVALGGLGAMTPPHGVNTVIGLLYYGSAAFVIVRWGLLALAIGTFVNSLLFDVVATRDTSAWYFGNDFVVLAVVLALAACAFWRAVPRERRAASGT
jgi:hypothetical protein